MAEFDPRAILPPDEEAPGGLVINPYSAWGKELRKWEQHRTELVPRGTNPGNPYEYRPYPKMLYQARKKPNGQVSVHEMPPDIANYDTPARYERDCLWVETFNASCQRKVQDDREEAIATGQGWCPSMVAALTRYERQQQDIARAAAEAAHAAQRMTPRAQHELAAADEATDQHVVDVQPAKRRGRPAKAKPGPVTA